MNFETIIYEVEKGRARITLNRPEKLNALSVELQEELNQALWEADNDNDVHAVILRGAGRAFSAGYDITPGRRGPAPVEGKNYRGRSSFDDDAWQMEKAMRLRMAIFEMRGGETPPAIVINEALELGRRYSGDQSARFLNGVLDAVRKTLEEQAAQTPSA